MKRNIRGKNNDLQDLANLHCQFAKSEDGSITFFGLFMVVIMMMVSGIGVDMMRHEMERTRIQSVADRAVLAAADIEQTLDPETVVRDYFEKAGMADYVSDVDVDQGVNFRTVTVDASTEFPTMFMDFLGVDELYVPALSTAEEKINKVEISMVLDISGSMRDNNKMVNLRDAAGTFADAVLTDDNRDLISVSVVPYTAQVNAGQEIFDLLDIEDRLHEWSYCVDFADSDFNDTAIYAGATSSTDPYVHMQHFEAGYTWYGNYASTQYDRITNPGCPKQSFEEIQAFSQSPADLKANINQFEPRANTSIHLGMKWGVAMLDPAWRDFNAVMPSVDAAFRSRPSDYADDETLKTVILMTDGVNVNTVRIKEDKYDDDAWRQFWSNMPLYGVLQRYNVNWNEYRETKYTATQADTLLQSVCDAAKAKKIVIWSIGFEVSDHGADVMRNCASSPSHFFRVEGIEISEAFQSIAHQINQLRLTQ